VVLMWCGC